MKNETECNIEPVCDSRREFLVKAAFLAGGLVLTLSGAASAFNKRPFDDLKIAIDDKSPLNKVGGSVIVDSTAGKIAIVRTGDATFVAASAICTHKGAVVEYDAAKKQFSCPKHGSKFDGTTGAVVKGPADEPLQTYTATGSATSVSVKIS